MCVFNYRVMEEGPIKQVGESIMWRGEETPKVWRWQCMWNARLGRELRNVSSWSCLLCGQSCSTVGIAFILWRNRNVMGNFKVPFKVNSWRITKKEKKLFFFAPVLEVQGPLRLCHEHGNMKWTWWDKKPERQRKVFILQPSSEN